MPEDLTANAVPTSAESGMTSQPAPASEGGPATPTQTPTGDSWQGVTREAAIAKYRELENKHTETTGQFNVLADFYRKVQPFFRFPDENTVELNDDMLRAYAQEKMKGDPNWMGSGPSAAQENTNTNAPATPNGNAGAENPAMDRYEPDEKAALRQMMKEVFREELSTNVTPHLTEFWKDRGERWMENIVKEHPDFPKYQAKAYEMAKKLGMDVRSQKDMENLYQFIKVQEGDYVDKSQLNSVQEELVKTRQMVNPNAGYANNPAMQRATDPRASVDDLLGLSNLQGSPEAAANMELFGKPHLKP